MSPMPIAVLPPCMPHIFVVSCPIRTILVSFDAPSLPLSNESLIDITFAVVVELRSFYLLCYHDWIPPLPPSFQQKSSKRQPLALIKSILLHLVAGLAIQWKEKSMWLYIMD